MWLARGGYYTAVDSAAERINAEIAEPNKGAYVCQGMFLILAALCLSLLLSLASRLKAVQVGRHRMC